jgi:hypothetical protein
VWSSPTSPQSARAELAATLEGAQSPFRSNLEDEGSIEALIAETIVAQCGRLDILAQQCRPAGAGDRAE